MKLKEITEWAKPDLRSLEGVLQMAYDNTVEYHPIVGKDENGENEYRFGDILDRLDIVEHNFSEIEFYA